MYARLLSIPDRSFFLFGVRGTGKSTWLRHHLSDAAWFNLLDERLFRELLVSPERFADALRPLRRDSWVVVDEVQRLPNLLNEVHRAIEEQGLRFALTGSSARKLKRAGVNMLAGRATRRAMLPLLPQELGADFDIDTALRYGTVPLVWAAADRGETLEDYVHTYLREEIQQEALVRNLAGFSRSIAALALYHGQVINVASLARDAEVQRKTAEGYLQVLEDTLMVQRLDAFVVRPAVRQRKKPKLYWVDAGIVRAAKGYRQPVTYEERGALFEGLVFQMLRHEVENARRYQSVHYWSTAAAGSEVDFLLRREQNVVAIEVKASERFRPEHCRGLVAIDAHINVQRKIVVYLGARALKADGNIDVWPLDLFAQKLAEGLL